MACCARWSKPAAAMSRPGGSPPHCSLVRPPSFPQPSALLGVGDAHGETYPAVCFLNSPNWTFFLEMTPYPSKSFQEEESRHCPAERGGQTRERGGLRKSARRAWLCWHKGPPPAPRGRDACMSPRLSICEHLSKLLPPAGHRIKHLTRLTLSQPCKLGAESSPSWRQRN